MKRNTPLDYAEFLLTHTRTRCELHIFANGVREKLASGYLKPFLTHLQAAEAQVAKGNQVIRLERPSNFLKKNKVTWFTKGTLERFVRFVSTPEVLERVKSIEDELSQLEHVRIALSKTFSQSEAPFQIMDDTNSSAGVYQTKGGVSMMRQRSSKGADDNGADASKIELLRAMDVRLVALKQEQSAAFSRATAAGFDNSNMADLLDFSEHFGAERLRDACIQFITLFIRKRNIAQVSPEELESADGASSGSDMSLESGTNVELVSETEADFTVDVEEAWPKALKSPDGADKLTGWDSKPGLKEESTISTSSASVRTRSRWGPPERIQISCLDPDVGGLQDSKGLRKVGEVRHQDGNYTHQDDSRHCESGMRTFQGDGEFHSTVHLKKQLSLLPRISSPIDLSDSTLSSFKGRKQQGDKEGDCINKGGMFFTRLQKMAQQVEARRSGEDLGVHFTSVEMSDESPGSQVSAFGNSSSLFESVLNPSEGTHSYTVADGVLPQPQSQESKLVPGHPPPGAISPMMQETCKVGGLRLGNSNSIIDSVADHPTIGDGFKNRKDNLEKSGETHATKSESSKVKDSQEEPVSSSARRLSVQAAISLFESKKSNVGEPPTRKLVRQDSQKGAVQSESSTSEKSVLQRWSGIGNDSPRDIQVKAPDMGWNEPEKVVEIEHATQKDETMVRNGSSRIDKLAQLQTDKISTQARQLFRNTFPHLSGSQQSAPDADAASPKHRPSVQQQSLVGDSSISSGEILQKQFKQELEKRLTRSAQTSVGVDAVLPHKSVAGFSKTSDVTLKRHPTDPKPESKDKDWASVSSMVLEVRRDPGNEENRNSTEQNMIFLPGNLAVTETAPKRLPSLKEDKADHLSVEKLKISKTNHETDKNIPTESKLSYGTSAQPNKEPSLILHDTPVDLYMQALVMMIDNHHQSSHSLGDEESYEDQRGRLYEHYWRLRNARQRGEPPARRAEREAKLKSMKETLEKRNAEMEAGVLRQAKKNSHLVKEQKSIGKHRVPKSGPLVTPGEMEELGGEEVGRQDRLLYAPSHALKHHVLKSRAQVSKKTAPNLQKSASAPRSIMTTPFTSSPRTMPQNPTGTRTIVNQRKLTASSYSGTLESPIHRTVPVDSRRDTSKFSSVLTAASVKSQEKINGCSQSVNGAVAAVVESNNEAEAEAESNKMAEAEAEASNAQAMDQIVLESFKGHQDVGPDTFMNGISSVVQDVKPFLHQGHALLPGERTGIVKQNVFDSRHSLERYNKDAFPGSNSCEDIATNFCGREDTSDFDLRKSLESDDLDCAVNPAGAMHSSSSDKCRSNDDGSHFVNSKSSDSLDVEEAGYIFEDASNDERILFINESDQGKHESNLSKDQMPARFNEGDTVYEKEGSAVTSAEKMVELSQSDSNSSASVLQECTTSTYSDAAASESSAITSADKMVEFSQSDSNSSASVLQECTTSTYSDAAASPANSFEGHFGTVLGAYSPKPAMPSDSPSGSPISWKSLKTNDPSEHDLSRSQRQYSVPQKLVSTTSQSNKEPARGFKRLLHFGRKSRASEAVSIDGISASTTSEGDDETEELKELMRQSSDELSRRAILHEKGPSLVSNKGHYSFQDQGAAHLLRSSIPTPPSNFKLRDDHLSGGTSLKGPRSFFSLSAFRSRGSEGKSR